MVLSEAREGSKLIISDTGSQDVFVQAVRFGIDVGSKIEVAKNIAGGPVIICKNHVEIAIGRDIAKAIQVIPNENI